MGRGTGKTKLRFDTRPFIVQGISKAIERRDAVAAFSYFSNVCHPVVLWKYFLGIRNAGTLVFYFCLPGRSCSEVAETGEFGLGKSDASTWKHSSTATQQRGGFCDALRRCCGAVDSEGGMSVGRRCCRSPRKPQKPTAPSRFVDDPPVDDPMA